MTAKVEKQAEDKIRVPILKYERPNRPQIDLSVNGTCSRLNSMMLK